MDWKIQIISVITLINIIVIQCTPTTNRPPSNSLYIFEFKETDGSCSDGYLCVVNNLCSANNEIITNGKGTVVERIDTEIAGVKFGVCDDIQYVCCKKPTETSDLQLESDSLMLLMPNEKNQPAISEHNPKNLTCPENTVCIRQNLCSANNEVITNGNGTIMKRIDGEIITVKSGPCDDIDFLCCHIKTNQLIIDPKPNSDVLMVNEEYKRENGTCIDGYACVRQNLCSTNHEIITNGNLTIMKRFGSRDNHSQQTNPCDDIEFVCCKIPLSFSACPEGYESVEYNECPEEKLINHDGFGILEIRNGFLDNYQCCKIDDETPSTSVIVDKKDDVLVVKKAHKCGVRYKDGVDDVNDPINNPNLAEYGEFQWTVIILKREKDIFICGGSLITTSIVLTSAHTIDELPPHTLKVRAGDWDTTNDFETYLHQEQNIHEILIHPNFTKDVLYNDIALMFLIQPFTTDESDNSGLQSSYINTICLPPAGLSFDNNRHCIVTGNGKTEYSLHAKYQRILKKIEVPIVGHNACQSSFRRNGLGPFYILDKSFICAGGERGKDACVGDGGSPLICPIPNTVDRYYQVGIVSWGLGCNDPIPGGYTNIPYLRPWIDDVLHNRNIDTSQFTYKP